MIPRQTSGKKTRALNVWFGTVGLLTISLAAGGCSSPPAGQLGPCPTPPAISPMTNENLDWFEETAVIVNDYAQQLVGFDEKAAETCVENAGLVWRVIARDGEYFAVTADYSPQRINAAIDRSVVTEISVG
jgi:hypothetical protein